MDGLQAAILSVKLPHIHEWSQKRLDHAKTYSKLLKDCNNIETPKIHPDVKHVVHLYVIRTKERSKLQSHLKDNGIATGIHYPTPLPFLKAYNYLGHKAEDFPVAYKYKDEILSLPMFAELSEGNIDYMVKQIRNFL